MPAMNNVISRHIPIEERSRSLAFIYSGMYVGSVLGLFLSPKIIEGFGWPSVFTSFGALGLVWFAVWRGLAHLMDTSESAATRAKSGAEASTSAASTTRPAPEIITLSDIATYPAEARPKQVPWKAFLTEPAVWALIGAHFMHNFSYFILLTWAPIYMTKVLGELLPRAIVQYQSGDVLVAACINLFTVLKFIYAGSVVHSTLRTRFTSYA